VDEEKWSRLQPENLLVGRARGIAFVIDDSSYLDKRHDGVRFSSHPTPTDIVNQNV
jgi:hypothetical protein